MTKSESVVEDKWNKEWPIGGEWRLGLRAKMRLQREGGGGKRGWGETGDGDEDGGLVDSGQIWN